jgi:hypothetical protein
MTAKLKKKAGTSFTLGLDTIEALRHVSEAERLPTSVLVDRILFGWLASNGHIAKGPRAKL